MEQPERPKIPVRHKAANGLGVIYIYDDFPTSGRNDSVLPAFSLHL